MWRDGPHHHLFQKWQRSLVILISGGLSPTAKGQLCRRSDLAALEKLTRGFVSAGLPRELSCLSWLHHGGRRQMISQRFSPSLTSYSLYFTNRVAFPLPWSSPGTTAPAIWAFTFKVALQHYPCPVLTPKVLLAPNHILALPNSYSCSLLTEMMEQLISQAAFKHF